MTTQTLELKNSLQLRLTQKMQQAIKLLQMPNQELATFVSAYVEANPLLEMESLDYDFNERGDAFSNDLTDHEMNLDDHDSNHTIVERMENNPYACDNVWQDDYLPQKSSSASHSDESYNPSQNIVEEETLKSFLHTQIDIVINLSDRDMAYVMIDLLNDDGYFIDGWQEELRQQGYDPSSKKIKKLIQTLQTFDPVGVFASSLEECLLLQLKDKNLYSEEIERLLCALKTHNGSPRDLAKKLEIPFERCEEILTLLRTLNPKPGAAITKTTVHRVIPDVLMKRSSPTQWSIELNSMNLPKIYLNSPYYIELKSVMKSLDDKNFLQEKYTEAKWLLKSLHQRAINILKVTDYIVRKQSEFFKTSSGRIKPLTLKEVAAETHLSESTVSRVTTDKFIETPRGLFELKYFFSSGVNSVVSSNLHSAKSVQSIIARIIQTENKDAPFSDNDIVEHLKLSGIYVARRTVAKYRDILKIENASERAKSYKWRQKDGKILAIRS